MYGDGLLKREWREGSENIWVGIKGGGGKGKERHDSGEIGPISLPFSKWFVPHFNSLSAFYDSNCLVVAGDVNLWSLMMMMMTTHYHIIITIIIISFPPPIYNLPARLDRTVHQCHRAREGRCPRRARWPPAARTSPLRPRVLELTAPGIEPRRPVTLRAVTGWQRPVPAVVINITFIYIISRTLQITSVVSVFITVIICSSNTMWYRSVCRLITTGSASDRYVTLITLLIYCLYLCE